jgi:hypothetical protein
MVIRGTTKLLGSAAGHGMDERATSREPSCSVDFRCPGGHLVTLTFAATAEIPPVWECRHCGRPARRDGQVQAPAECDEGPDVPARHRDSTWTRTARSQTQTTSPRTPWIMLRERRTIQELQVLLDERLAHLRDSRRAITFHGHKNVK